MRPTFSSALLVLLPLVTACDDDQGAPGVWQGSTVTNVSFQLTLVETPQGAVTGVGVVANGLTNTPTNATGAHAHPTLALTITFPQSNIAPINYQGTFSRDLMSIRGVLTGSGFGLGLVRDSLVLNRITPSVRITAP